MASTDSLALAVGSPDSLWLDWTLTLSVGVGSADHSVLEVANSVEEATSEVSVALSEPDVALSDAQTLSAAELAAEAVSTTGVSEYEGTADAVTLAHQAVNSAKVALTSVPLSARTD